MSVNEAERVLAEVSPDERARMRLAALRADINTAIPATVRKRRGGTVDVEISILRTLTNGGALRPLEIDMVPVVYPGSGGWSFTFPIAQGDTGLLVFSQRDADKWFAEGVTAKPPTRRMHDFSDAIFIPGLRIDEDAPSIPDSLQVRGPGGLAVDIAPDGAVTLRSGSASLSMKPDGAITLNGSTVDVTGSTAATLSAPTATVEGSATATLKAPAAAITGGGGSVTAGPGGAPVIANAGGGSGGDLGALVLALARALAQSQVQGGSSAGPLSSAGTAAAIAAQLEALQGG